MTEKQVDEDGVPINYDANLSSAPYCPDEPCRFCTGNSNVVIGRDKDSGSPIYQTSWDWCQELKTCAATVEWDKTFNHD